MTDNRDSNLQGMQTATHPGTGIRRRYRVFKGSGRAKGSKNRKTIVREVMQETHGVTENRKNVHRSTLELVLFRLRNMALEGKSQRAAVELLKILEEYEPQPNNSNVGVLVVPGPAATREEFRAECDELVAIMKEQGFRSMGQASEFRRKQRRSKSSPQNTEDLDDQD